jgi:hypothetical protein
MSDPARATNEVSTSPLLHLPSTSAHVGYYRRGKASSATYYASSAHLYENPPRRPRPPSSPDFFHLARTQLLWPCLLSLPRLAAPRQPYCLRNDANIQCPMLHGLCAYTLYNVTCLAPDVNTNELGQTAMEDQTVFLATYCSIGIGTSIHDTISSTP